jgi:hypothetical protein
MSGDAAWRLCGAGWTLTMGSLAYRAISSRQRPLASATVSRYSRGAPVQS